MREAPAAGIHILDHRLANLAQSLVDRILARVSRKLDFRI